MKKKAGNLEPGIKNQLFESEIRGVEPGIRFRTPKIQPVKKKAGNLEPGMKYQGFKLVKKENEIAKRVSNTKKINR